MGVASGGANSLKATEATGDLTILGERGAVARLIRAVSSSPLLADFRATANGA